MRFPVPPVILLTGCGLLIAQLVSAATTTGCPPPDFPENGLYSPEDVEYEVGMQVRYTCTKGWPMVYKNKMWFNEADNNIATCQSNGKWSELTFFCDNPKKLKPSEAEHLILLDDKRPTCIGPINETERTFRFSLDGEWTPYYVQICFKRGTGKFSLKLSSSWIFTRDVLEPGNYPCYFVQPTTFRSRTDSITVKVSSQPNSSISVCEINVLAKDDKFCDYPPDVSVPNGQLEVSHSKAVLYCKEGFREKDGRDVYATCLYNRWSFLNLECVEDKFQKDHKIPVCLPPDFPERGKYEPKKVGYKAGMKVTYTCNGQYGMFDESSWAGSSKMVTCQPNGNWSERTPFCDIPTELRLNNPTGSSIGHHKGSIINDGRVNTCFPIPKGIEENLEYFLKRKLVVYSVFLCMANGTVTIEANLSASTHFIYTSNFDVSAGQVACSYGSIGYNTKKTKNVTIRIAPQHSTTTFLCELSFYVKDVDEWCESLPERPVSNGHLEVGRGKAVLHCNEGFRERDGKRIFAICTNNTWIYLSLKCVASSCDLDVDNPNSTEVEWKSDGNASEILGSTRTLKCKPGYHSEGEPLTVTCLDNGTWTQSSATCKKDEPQKDYKILGIVVGSVIVIVILILVGLTVFSIRRKKPTGLFAMFKAGENNNHSSLDDPINTNLIEAESST